MKPTLTLLGALLLAPLAALQASDAPKPKPNIIVVLVDDMGFSDIGCYGGEIPTPHIDSLAAGGLRFTQFYNMGRCCPTRASLLTGLYPHQAGMGDMTVDEKLPSYRGYLNDQCITLGEALRGAGYFTALTGKWHVGEGDVARLPLQRGFDRFYGAPEGGGFYFTPKAGRSVMFGNEVLYTKQKPPPADWYSTDAWTDYGLRFIDEARAAKQPFFLYLAHNAPHYPLQAPPEDIARFRGRFKAGWDKLREQRHQRQKSFGLIAESSSLCQRDAEVAAWDTLDPQMQDTLDLRMAIYAAVMHRLDASMGRLIDGLKQRGVFEDTVVFFLSDNGAEKSGGVFGTNDGPGEPHKPKAAGTPGSADSYIHYGQAWANLSNTPFRLYKRTSHEGGISTPCIVHWPRGIAGRGEWRTQVAHVVDLMPTLLELAGEKYPAEFKGRRIMPMEGRSLVPTFSTANIETRRLFWEHEGSAAVRDGDWKLVRLGASNPWELYDLATDRQEAHDLASEQPERVQSLVHAWEEWARRVAAKPFAGKS